MHYLKRPMPMLAILLSVVPLPFALAEQVLSTFIYTHHGDRTPMATDENPNLTPLGARQLYQAGINMRNRYVRTNGLSENSQSFIVREISDTYIENRQINILSSTEEWVTASAQAFMQGLYPPLTVNQNYTLIAGESDLANGSNIIAPLGGYQYPNVAAASPYDPRSIYIKGTDNCPQYLGSMVQYYNSSRYEISRRQSQPFYDSLKEPFLNGIFDDSAVGYYDAYYIWDYLSYAYVHNQTVANKLSIEDYTRARILAGNWMFDMYANSSADGEVGRDHIRAIAGRTLAYYITQAFSQSIRTKGKYNKMNLVFGDYIPMMSFAALAELMTEQTGAFFNAPAPGASIILELFTLQPQSTFSSYPKTTDMFVRFLYQNGTDSSSSLIEYSLFGRSPSQAMMTWGDFINAMSGITVSDTEDWCRTCASSSVFCEVTGRNNQYGSVGSGRGLKPAIAGVIGAIAALVFIALLTALAMFLGGVRFYRQSRGKSELGGFKGTEKLASDQDLTVPKGGAGVSVHEEPRGHERVGSWELKEPVRVQSGIDTAAFGPRSHGLENDDTVVDPYAEPVKARDTF